MDGGAVNFHHMGLGTLNVGAHPLQNIQQDAYIGNIGDILDAALAADQQRRRQNGHSGIFRAADGDAAVQGPAAVDFIYSQG